MIYLGKVMMSQKVRILWEKNISFPVPSQRNWHTKTLSNFEKLLNNKIDQKTPICQTAECQIKKLLDKN